MAEARSQHSRRNRPRSITLVIWGIILLGLANLWRAVGLFRQRELLRELDAWPDPRVSFLIALVWTFVFLFNGLTLLRGNPSIRLVTPALIFGYALYRLSFMWLGSVQNTGTDVTAAAILLYSFEILLAVWALNRRSVRWYFQSEEEYGRSEN